MQMHFTFGFHTLFVRDLVFIYKEKLQSFILMNYYSIYLMYISLIKAFISNC